MLTVIVIAVLRIGAVVHAFVTTVVMITLHVTTVATLIPNLIDAVCETDHYTQ
jgi:hypothetical protein